MNRRFVHRLATASGRGAAVATVVVTAIALGACATQINRHGHVLNEATLAQIQPGMSQDAVKLALGTPDTTSTIDGKVYYYISSTSEGYAFLNPSITERRVVAIYFSPLGSVERVGNYGMEDGQIIDIATRQTPTAQRDKGFLASLFKGIGQKKVENKDQY